MAVGGIFVTLRAITSKFQSDFAKAKMSVDRFRKSTVNINRQLKKVGKTMSRVGKSMAASFSLPIVAAGGLAVKTFADFEQQMAKVKAVSGATGEEFNKLENLAKSLGESTRFTASQVAELELNYSKLGFVPEEIQKITKSTLNLALATGEDLANSAEVAGSTLRGLALTADQMPRVVDVMAKSFSSTALDLESFRESMKLVAPTAVATGRSLEEVTTFLGILANNGIKGSIAGTQLNRVFIELNKKGLTLEQALDQVSNSTNGLATATGLVKDRGAKALLILAKQRKELGPLRKKLEGAAGAAEAMAEIMDDTLQGSLLRVQSALEGAAIELGQTLAPVIKKVGAFIAEMAQKFSALSPETKKTIAIVAGLTAAIGPLLVVMGIMASTVIPALITGFGLLLSPVVLIAGAIAAIGAVALIASNHINRVQGANQALIGTLEKAEQAASGEIASIQKLVTIAKSEVISRKQRQAAIDELQEKYPNYLKNLSLESINSKEAGDSIKKLKTSILQLAQARAIHNRIQEIEAEKLELSTSAIGENLTIVDKLKAALSLALDPTKALAIQQELQATALERTAEQTKALTDESDLLIEKLADLEKVQDNLNVSTKSAADLAREATEAEAERQKALLSAAVTPIGEPAKPKKKARAEEVKELIPLIIQLQRAQEAAKLFSEAFTEEPRESLERQREALKSFIAESLKAEGEITPAIQSQIDLYNELGKQIDLLPQKTKSASELIKENALRTAEFIQGVKSQIAVSLGETIGEALAKGDPAAAFKGFIKDILGVVKAFGTTLIAIGTGLTASIFGIVEGPKTIAAGIALIAAATAGAALFAQGGLVFGETLGLIGEGRGTTRANPEVVAPLDKLQAILGTQQGGMQEIEFVLTGETLRAVTNKTAENRSFTTRE